MGVRYVRVDTSICKSCHIELFQVYNCFRLQILCVIPVPIVRWVLVIAAFASSGYFLVVNIYPILASVSFVALSRVSVMINAAPAG